MALGRSEGSFEQDLYRRTRGEMKAGESPTRSDRPGGDVSPGSHVAISLVLVSAAAALGAVVETVWLATSVPAQMTVGERLILVANAMATVSLLSLPVIAVVELVSGLFRHDGAPWSWLRLLRQRMAEEEIVRLSVGCAVVALVIAAGATLAATRPLYRHVYNFKNAGLATTAGTLLGLASVLMVAAFWLPTFALLRIVARRLLGASADWVRRCAWLLTPLGVTIGIGFLAAAVALVLLVRNEEVVRSYQLDLAAVRWLPAVIYVAGRILLPRWRRGANVLGRLRWYGAAVLLAAVLCGSAAVTLVTVKWSQRLRPIRERYAPLSGLIITALTFVWDDDGDGHPRIVGWDCDDTDPGIHPGALEVPGDGIDQDCFEGDLDPAVVTAMFPTGTAPGVGPKDEPPDLPGLRNVVLITVDALRPDRLGTYGYLEHPTSPNIDRLAAESIVFERAYSAAPQTRRSIQALLMGLYPRGVLWGKGRPSSRVLADNVNLAERLKPHMFWAGAFYGGTWMSKTPGYFQGFELWDLARAIGKDAARVKPDSTAPFITDMAIPVIREHLGKGHRVFAWIHYTEPHSPYSGHPGFEHFGSSAHDRYCAEIAKADVEIGRLIDAIRSGPGKDETVIIVTADHGEAFREHGTAYHFRNLYEEETRVPLILFVPGLTPARIGGVASLVDVSPTILSLLGLPAARKTHGIDLVPYMLGRPPAEDRVVLMDASEYADSAANRAAVYRNGFKLLLNVETGTFELYDLIADPLERHNVFDDRHRVATELRRLLALYRAGTEDPGNSSELVSRKDKKKRKIAPTAKPAPAGTADPKP